MNPLRRLATAAAVNVIFRSFESFMILLLCFSSALTASRAQAGLIYDNLSQTPVTTASASDSGRTGLSFATDATNVVLDSVVIPVWNFMGLTSGSVDMSLFDATGPGAVPGTQLAALGSAPISSFPSATYQNFSITGLSINLAPTTNYWIVMGATSIGANYSLGLTNNSTGAGPLSIGYGVFSGGGPWVSSNSWYVIGSVSAVSPAPVPEIDPAGMGSVLALVTGVLGLMERRRVRPARTTTINRDSNSPTDPDPLSVVPNETILPSNTPTRWPVLGVDQWPVFARRMTRHGRRFKTGREIRRAGRFRGRLQPQGDYAILGNLA